MIRLDGFGHGPAPDKETLVVVAGSFVALHHVFVPGLNIALGLSVIAASAFDLVVGDQLVFDVVGETEKVVARLMYNEPVGMLGGGKGVDIVRLTDSASAAGDGDIDAVAFAVTNDGEDFGLGLRRSLRGGRMLHE